MQIFVEADTTTSSMDKSDLSRLDARAPAEKVENLVTFAIFGASAGFIWEAIMNSLPTICQQLFPEIKALSDSVTTSMNVGILITACLMSVVSPLKPRLMKFGIITVALSSIVLAWICLYMTHSDRAKYPIILVCFIAGFSSGLVEAAAFAFAMCIDSNLTGSFSVGFGLSGIVSFGFWMLFTHVFFPTNNEADRLKATVAEQVLSIVVSLVSLVFVQRMEHMPSYKSLQLHKRSVDKKVTPQRSGDFAVHLLEKGSTSFTDSSLLDVIIQTLRCQISLGFVLFVSYAVMPNLIPIELHESTYKKDCLTGMFQVSDFVGRSVASLVPVLPCLMIPEKLLQRLTCLRVVFLIIAALATLDGSSSRAWFPYWVQITYIILCAFTNGWFLTLLLAYLGTPLKTDNDKGRASAFSVLIQLFGIVFGILASVIIKRI